VNHSSQPSLFNGEFEGALADAFRRIRFGGVPSQAQRVYFINLQEIKGIKFGTRNPVNYFDNFYNAELFLRAHGSYSVKIVNPLTFFAEAVPRNADIVDFRDINQQYTAEFMTAFQSAINKMSLEGIRISHVTSKGMELAKYMSSVLDEDWTQMRGMQVQSIGIDSISYSEESQRLINRRNEGAMLQNPSVREGYVQGSIADSAKAAASNPNGAMHGFMGMNFGMNTLGDFLRGASESNRSHMQSPQVHVQRTFVTSSSTSSSSDFWTCACGEDNIGRFCTECGAGKPAPAAGDRWACGCGQENTGKFCTECGTKRPAAAQAYRCDKCGFESPSLGNSKFCPECGDPIDKNDVKA
jgi:membrane protease subunit (stomatin/prohibitin family)